MSQDTSVYRCLWCNEDQPGHKAGEYFIEFLPDKTARSHQLESISEMLTRKKKELETKIYE